MATEFVSFEQTEVVEGYEVFVEKRSAKASPRVSIKRGGQVVFLSVKKWQKERHIIIY